MLPSHHHAVQFYEGESQLAGTVSGFLCEGLICGHPAMVIATAAHRAVILEAMHARFIDVSRVQRVGALLMLDAHKILSQLRISGSPERDRVAAVFGAQLARAAGGLANKTVRAYGEIVDILWQDGRTQAALDLEALWNGLARRHRFALLCGYRAESSCTQDESFQAICDQHTHVIGPDARLTLPRRRRDAPPPSHHQ